MRISWMNGCTLLAVVVVAGGCATNLKDENALLRDENEDLRAQLSDRNGALEASHDESREQALQLAQMRREAEQLKDAAIRGGTGFDGIEGVSGTVGAGEVTAAIASDVLFDSGKATLKAGAKRTLEAVASVLETSYAGRPIRISGHTDSDPIRKSGHQSNHHLAFDRAYAVRQHLVSNGVAAGRMYVASYGPDRPKAMKAESRRVEIVVIVN